MPPLDIEFKWLMIALTILLILFSGEERDMADALIDLIDRTHIQESEQGSIVECLSTEESTSKKYPLKETPPTDDLTMQSDCGSLSPAALKTEHN